MKQPPTDPELVRDRLAVLQGKHYWRSLEELAGDPSVEEMLRREFPDRAGEWTDPISRRRFLALMGASLTLAGLSGCTRPPTGTIMPYVRQPANLVPGKPLYYATSMTLGGFATGLLVESHEGRPTKIEGNPQHPASLGATNAFHQAAILGLYDPDRAQAVTYRGQPRGWGDVVEELRNRLHPSAGRATGKGLVILAESAGSPTLDAQRGEFLANYPDAKWFEYEPVNRDNGAAGSRVAFGKVHHVYHKPAKAEIIVALDADFLAAGPAHLAYTREFASRRREAGGKNGMNRLYCVETELTITGARADHRLALRPTLIEAFARSLAAKLGVAGAQAATLDDVAARWVEVVAKDLQKHKPGATLVLAGDGQPAAVHAISHAINHKLGNLGSTVILTEPPLADRAGSMKSLDQLDTAIGKGEVDTLIILGGNPAYTAPADIQLGELLKRQLAKQPREKWLTVHLGLYFDETARLCHWHIPQAHFLETWSDAVAFDGTASIVQPLIAPLYAGRSAHEVIAAITRRRTEGVQPGSDYDDRSPHELIRDYWKAHRPAASAQQPFERFWQQALHDGFIAGTARPSLAPALAADLFGKPEMKPAAIATDGKSYELLLAPDPAVYDGRFANNGWLQEFPRPITRITWDNAVLMSPATAEKLGVGDRVGKWRGGEHGQSFADVVMLEHGRRTIEAPAWIVPGHADGALTLYLGYGRTYAGKVATDVGRDANKLRLSSAPWVLTGVKVAPRRDKTHTIACVQAHHSMEGRDIVRSGSLAEYQKDNHFAQSESHIGAGGKAKQEGGRRVSLPSLYSNEHPYKGYKWGMAIDLSACTGCGSCVIACQAENNSPVVGKEQVTRGREMHWLRIDRYFETARDDENNLDQLRVHFQPVMCQHCENAPCEVVCPVEATAHGEEGTNDMVYNRCVGTRYCANNCPYKVRRFNFLQFSDYDTPSLKLMYNPDVTVRTRGVMEKCTFCIQRISHARIDASKAALEETDRPGEKKRADESRPGLAKIHDGEVVTACQAACPALAIVFGDLNDTSSRVHHLHESPLRYDLLGELGVLPRVAYLAALRNPNPELESK